MVVMFSALFVLISMGLWLPLLEDEIGGMLSRLQCVCMCVCTCEYVCVYVCVCERECV